jgi:glycine betaine/proline transport system substrate-binding protein
MWINVPKEGYEDTKATGVNGAVTDPIYMGYIPNDIVCVANLDFLKNNPAAEALFTSIKLELADISGQNVKMFEGEDSQKDIERHVDEWIENNKMQWDAWIEAAINAAK